MSKLDPMRKLFAIALAGAVMISPARVADAESVPNPRTLGIKESILSYCTRVDPSAAATLRQNLDGLLHGSSAATVAALRKTNEYRAGYSAVTNFVGKVEKQNAAKPCVAALAATKSGGS